MGTIETCGKLQLFISIQAEATEKPLPVAIGLALCVSDMESTGADESLTALLLKGRARCAATGAQCECHPQVDVASITHR
jgi:hypothetical protein